MRVVEKKISEIGKKNLIKLAQLNSILHDLGIDARITYEANFQTDKVKFFIKNLKDIDSLLQIDVAKYMNEIYAIAKKYNKTIAELSKEQFNELKQLRDALIKELANYDTRLKSV